MKKVLLTLCLACAGLTAVAQEKGDKAIGAKVVYATEFERLGFSLKGQYNITKPLRAEASFTYFLKKYEANLWMLDLNAHYLFNVADKVNVYPLAGLSYSHASVSFLDETVSKGKFGFNLGGGVDYSLTDKISLNAEAKYLFVNEGNTPLISAGLSFKL